MNCQHAGIVREGVSYFMIVNFFIPILVLSVVTVILCNADILEDHKEGLLNILYGKKETKNKKKYGAIFYCPMCMGFWVGLIGYNFFDIKYLTDFYILNMFLVGFFVSYFSSLLNKYLK